MSTKLLFEGFIGGTWVPLGYQSADMPFASISDISTGQREIYLTKCYADHACVYRSPGGIDVEHGLTRIVHTDIAQLVLVKRLEIGDTHEMTIQPSRLSLQPVRFRCAGAQ